MVIMVTWWICYDNVKGRNTGNCRGHKERTIYDSYESSKTLMIKSSHMRCSYVAVIETAREKNLDGNPKY